MFNIISMILFINIIMDKIKFTDLNDDKYELEMN